LARGSLHAGAERGDFGRAPICRARARARRRAARSSSAAASAAPCRFAGSRLAHSSRRRARRTGVRSPCRSRASRRSRRPRRRRHLTTVLGTVPGGTVPEASPEVDRLMCGPGTFISPRGSGSSAVAELGRLVPARPRSAPERGPRSRPSTRHSRAGRAAPSSPHRTRPHGIFFPAGPLTSFLDPRPQLVGRTAESGRPDGARRSPLSSAQGIAKSLMGSVERVRRPEIAGPDAPRDGHDLVSQLHGHEVRSSATASSRSPTAACASRPRHCSSSASPGRASGPFGCAAGTSCSSLGAAAVGIFLNQVRVLCTAPS